MPELLYLMHEEVAASAPPLQEIIDAVAFALTEKAHGRVHMPPKPTLHPRPGTLLQAMPAWVDGAGGVKWVSAFPDNKQHGLPALSGLLLLNNSENGLTEAILDAAWITAARTGSASAVAARALARPDSQILGVLGAGVQARVHVAALKLVLPRLNSVRVYAPRAESVEGFRRDIANQHGIEVQAAASAEEVVRQCDVLVTATTWPRVTGEPPIQPAWLKPGVFASIVDLDASFTPGAVAQFDRRFVDDLPTFATHGERGTFRGWAEAEDLARMVAGMSRGRGRNDERLLAIILGLGIYDVVVARRVVEEARRRGAGTVLPR